MPKGGLHGAKGARGGFGGCARAATRGKGHARGSSSDGSPLRGAFSDLLRSDTPPEAGTRYRGRVCTHRCWGATWAP